MSTKGTKILFWSITGFFVLIFAGAMLLFAAPIGFGEGPAVLLLLPLMTFLFATAILTCLAIFIKKDAPKHGLDPYLWMTIALYVPNLIGLIIYFVMRSQNNERCSKCDKSLKSDMNVCPYCGEPCKNTCPNCHEAVEKDWRICPNCEVTLTPSVKKSTKSSKTPLIVAGIILVVCVAFLFIGATVIGFNTMSTTSVGSVSSFSHNHISSRFVYLNGTEKKSISVEAGNQLTIDYDCGIEKGSLKLLVLNGDKDVIGEVDHPTKGQLVIDVNEKDKYQLHIIAEKASGYYEFEWHK